MSFRDHEQTNEVFAGRVKDAFADYYELAEEELKRRGVDGVTKDVWYQGEVVGSEIEYDTTALIFLLKGGMPEKYNPARGGLPALPGGEGDVTARITREYIFSERLMADVTLRRQAVDVAKQVIRTLDAGQGGTDAGPT